MQRFMDGSLSAQRNWLPGILVKILRVPVETELINISDYPRVVLYALERPDFAPVHCDTLDYIAIGSGEDVQSQIDLEADAIFALEPGNLFVEAMALRQCVSEYMVRAGIESVGGLFPCVKAERDGVVDSGFRTQIPAGGTQIELALDGRGNWIQRNLTTGRTLELQRPWEVDPRKHLRSDRFDDLIEAKRSLYTDKGLTSPL